MRGPPSTRIHTRLELNAGRYDAMPGKNAMTRQLQLEKSLPSGSHESQSKENADQVSFLE